MQPQDQTNGETSFRQASTLQKGKFKRGPQPNNDESNQIIVGNMPKKYAQVVEAVISQQNQAKKVVRKKPAPSATKSEKVNVIAEWTDSVLSGAQGKWAAEYERDTSLVYKWNGNFWDEVFKTEGEAIIADWLTNTHPKLQSPMAVKQAFDFAEMRLRSTSPLPKQTRKIIIPLTGAYCEVKEDGTIVMGDPDPALGMKYAVNCRIDLRGKYQPKPIPSNSRFYKFLSHVQPDEHVRALIQEQCAMSLIPGRKNNCAWWFGPKARNGKGTTVELLKRFHYKTGNFNLKKLDDPFHLEPGYGASFWVCDEVEKGRWAEGAFKTFITGNGMTVGRKHRPNIANYQNEGYAIIMSNPKPLYTDQSVAERIVAVEWKVHIAEDERTVMLDELIFDEEAHIVLDWLLEGVQRIIKRGGNLMPMSERPQAVQDLRQELDLENDVLSAWMADTGAKVSPYCSHTKSEIYDAYLSWAQNEGKTVLDAVVFWRGFWGKGEMRENRASIEFQRKGQRKLRFALNEADDLAHQCMSDDPEFFNLDVA